MPQRLLPWLTFVVVHAILILQSLYGSGYPIGDVTLVYTRWAEESLAGGGTVGITVPWVYPVGALVPILLPALGGMDSYLSGWYIQLVVLNACAFAILLYGRHPVTHRLRAALVWMGLLLVLGPVGVNRIDALTVPLVLVGLLWVSARPAVAGAILAVATWIKIWPAAVGLALIVAVKQRLHVLAGALLASGGILLIAWLCGAGTAVFSFITEQTDRGLQVESVLATPWMWAALAPGGDSFVYYDNGILTYQVVGPGVPVLASLSTVLLAALVLIVALLGVRAVASGASGHRLVLALCLALITALIIGNKVGSPQFAGWLIAPLVIAAGLALTGWRVPLIGGAVVLLCTQVLYPVLYMELLSGTPAMTVILTVRNLGYITLFAWAIRELWRLGARGRGARDSDSPDDDVASAVTDPDPVIAATPTALTVTPGGSQKKENK
ncbi:MAG: glycosyltransferase 87 family protein [Mycetocola sp.]